MLPPRACEYLNVSGATFLIFFFRYIHWSQHHPYLEHYQPSSRVCKQHRDAGQRHQSCEQVPEYVGRQYDLFIQFDCGGHGLYRVRRIFCVGSVTVTNRFCSGSTVPNQAAGVFWAVLNRLLIIGQTVVLLLSEFGWPSVFFNRFFPVLGDDFGLGALGIIQCLYVLQLHFLFYFRSQTMSESVRQSSPTMLTTSPLYPPSSSSLSAA